MPVRWLMESTRLSRKCATFPPTYNLMIPEQDARAPEEDWSAGLPLVLRGIQQKDWDDIATGIVLSLEQTENYERQRGGDVSGCGARPCPRVWSSREARFD